MGLFNRRKKKPADEPLPNARQEWKDEIPWGTVYGGRELDLPAPLEIASAPALAQWFVDVFAGETDVTLDYSVRSLEDVDSILAEFEERGSERTAEVTACAGFYAGEVFVRNHGFRWHAPEENPLMQEFDAPRALGFAISAPGDDAQSNIVNKAFKRVENGDEDSLAFFGRFLLADLRSTPEPDAP